MEFNLINIHGRQRNSGFRIYVFLFQTMVPVFCRIGAFSALRDTSWESFTVGSVALRPITLDRTCLRKLSQTSGYCMEPE